MSASRGGRLSRKRKKEEDSQSLAATSIHDITDDFQDAATVFRVPKRVKIEKPQQAAKKPRGRPKKTNSSSSAEKDDGSQPKSKSSQETLQLDDSPIIIESENVDHVPELGEDNSELLELEQSVCSDSEKLCPCCKHIVPSAILGEHFKECMQKYKHVTRKSERNTKGKKNNDILNEESNEILPCPVCSKVLKSKAQRQSHIKSCATSLGFTSEQIVQASRVQEKQANKQDPLGLPLTLPQTDVREKKKSKTKPQDHLLKKEAKKDPDLAMALALSRSLVEEEAEERASREEKLLELGLHDIVDEDRKAQPLVLIPPETAKGQSTKAQQKGKGRKKNACWRNAVLTNRSREERERIISEKVAAILASEDTLGNGWEDSGNGCRKASLMKYRDENCSLWGAAHRHSDHPLKDYYVPDLEPYIEPKNVAVGSLLRSLSQIPGRLNITAFNAIDENSDSESDGESTRNFCLDRDSTQLVLAELLGSQDCLDITRTHNAIEAEQITEVEEFEDPTTDPNVTIEAASGFWIHHLPGEGSEGKVKSNVGDHNKDVNSGEVCESSLTTEDLCNEEICQDKSKNLNILPSSIEIVESDIEMDVVKNTIDLEEECTSDSCKKKSNIANKPMEISLCDELDDSCDSNVKSNLSERILNDSESNKTRIENIIDCTSENECSLKQCENDEKELVKSSESVQCNKITVNNISKHSADDQQSVNKEHSCSEIQEHDSESSMNSVETHVFFEDGDCNFSESSRHRLHTDETVLYADFTDDSSETKTFCSPDRRIPPGESEIQLLKLSNESDDNKDSIKTTPETVLLSDSQGKVSTNEQIINKKEEKNCQGQCLNQPQYSGPLNPLHAKLIYDWASLLASGEGTDVSLTTSEGNDLQAHSLVILVRCPKLYQELESSGKKAHWLDICFEGAYIFISYLYTGTCEIKAKDDPLWMDVFDLALKYECEDLVTYLESLYKAKPTPVKVVSAVAPNINLTPKPHNTPKGEKSIERNVRRCINLTLDSSVYDDQKADETIGESKQTQHSNTPNMAAHVEDKDEICSTKSPDLFDESHVSHSDSFSSATDRSSRKLVLDQSPGIIVTKGVCKESSEYPLLELELESHRRCSASSNLSDSFENPKDLQVEITSPDTRNSSNCMEISHTENNTTKENSVLTSDEVRDTDSFRENDKDVIDLTHCSSGSSQSSEASVSDIAPIPGACNNVLDSESDNDDMEPLKLGEGTETDDVESADSLCGNVNALQPSMKMHPDTANDDKEESMDKTYISNVWDDYDDMGCEVLPLDILPATPVKRMCSSAVGINEKDIEMQVSCNKTSSSLLEKSPVVTDITCSNQIKECSPKMEVHCNKDNYEAPSVQKEHDIPEIVIASTSPISDETLVRLSEDFDDSNIWKDDFDPYSDFANPATQKNGEMSLLKPVSETLKTPNNKISSNKKAITPMPDYKSMPSPKLKTELEKYGIRPISRRKAALLLQHIYEQTHPLVTDSEAESSFCETPQRSQLEKPKKTSALHKKVLTKKTTISKKANPCTKKKATTTETVNSTSRKNEETEEEYGILNSSQASSTSDGSEFDCVEESIMMGDDEDDALTSTQQDNIGSKVVDYIRSEPELYNKILLYEPIFVDELQASLKINGIKISMNNLLEILDEQCITFRTQQGQRNRSRKRKSPKKKKIASPRKS